MPEGKTTPPMVGSGQSFAELDVVQLLQHFDGPDGRIPSGTAGIVLQVFDHGEAYQIEFEGPHDVPETVPATLLVPHARFTRG